MEVLLSLSEIVPEFINEITLVYAVKEGKIIPYRKESLSPVNVERILSVFEETRKHMNLQMESPEWAIDQEKDLPTEKRIFPKFTMIDICQNGQRTSWIDIYDRIIKSIKSCEIEHAKYKKIFNKTEEIKYIEIDGCYDTCGIPSDQFFEILEGVGSSQILEIIKESVFKKSDILNITSNDNQQINQKEYLYENNSIGVSERETWLKVILLLSYSLAIELQGDEADILNKKGRKKINPDKLASFLKNKAGEMFGEKDNPGHRCGKTTIDNILDEAEKKLSPDIHAFLSPQA